MSVFSSSSSHLALSRQGLPTTSTLVSIVIPVYNESACLNKNIALFSKLKSPLTEIIFVDGGSSDDTVGQLTFAGYRVVSSEKGRANQMNMGASCATAESLLFLHADVSVPENFLDVLSLIPGAAWGFFKVRLRSTRWIYRVISAGINMRSQLFGVATGDQGVFVDRNFFNQSGGYPVIALMEDVALSRKLKQQKKPKIIDAYLNVSARRWEHRGVIKTVLLMWGIQLAYVLGVSPQRLAHWYR